MEAEEVVEAQEPEALDLVTGLELTDNYLTESFKIAIYRKIVGKL